MTTSAQMPACNCGEKAPQGFPRDEAVMGHYRMCAIAMQFCTCPRIPLDGPIYGHFLECPIATELTNWTGQDGRSNSSVVFKGLEAAITDLIRNGAHTLINSGPSALAGTIVARLAHVHRLAPLGWTLNRAQRWRGARVVRDSTRPCCEGVRQIGTLDVKHIADPDSTSFKTVGWMCPLHGITLI